MEFKTISSSEEITPHELSNLVISQSMCWGESPFSEFGLCDGCGLLHSITDMCGESRDLENINYSCQDCDGLVELMYLNDSFEKEISEYLNFCCSLILLMGENEEILGFGLMVKKKIQDLLEYEFATRPDSHDFSNEQSLVFGNNVSQEVLCLQQIYIDCLHRGQGFAGEMLRKLLLSFPSDLARPVVLETRFDSGLYPLTRSLGFSDVGKPDKYGYVMQKCRSGIEALDILGNDKSNSQIQKTLLQEYSQQAGEILSNNPGFTGKKNYKY